MASRVCPLLPIIIPISSPLIFISSCFSLRVVSIFTISPMDMNISFKNVFAILSGSNFFFTLTTASLAPNIPKNPLEPSSMTSISASSFVMFSSLRASSTASSTVLPVFWIASTVTCSLLICKLISVNYCALGLLLLAMLFLILEGELAFLFLLVKDSVCRPCLKY